MTATKAPAIRRLRLCNIDESPSRLAARRELLHALAFECFARVEVPARVDGDAADARERARPPAAGAEVANRRQRAAIDDQHLLVAAIGDKQILLRGVRRQRD